MTTSHTTNELLTVQVARCIRDEDLVFVGVGTNGRAFALAVGIPLAGLRLAQMTHAPAASVYWGNLLDPDLSSFPEHLRQDSLTRWHAAASPVDVGYKCDMLARRGFDVSFDSGAQIDRFGNLNITAIGDYARPTVRLVGCLAQPEHFAFVRRPIVMMDLNRRNFVDRVDFVTSVGHARDGRSREQWGLGPGGPAIVITDKAIFDFETGDGSMRLKSLHDGVHIDDVLDNLGFTPALPQEIPTTAAPSDAELELIRSQIDPGKILLRH